MSAESSNSCRSSDAILMVVAALTSADDFSCDRIANTDHPITGFVGGIFRPPQAA
jgi:hypothetical protein